MFSDDEDFIVSSCDEYLNFSSSLEDDVINSLDISSNEISLSDNQISPIDNGSLPDNQFSLIDNGSLLDNSLSPPDNSLSPPDNSLSLHDLTISSNNAKNNSDFLPLSSFIPPSKFSALSSALKSRHSNIIVVSGPSGSLKSTLIYYILSSLSLTYEYIEDVTQYKSLLNKSAVCLTDIDDLEYFLKHKAKINLMSNLIIETRLLPYMYKNLSNGVGISITSDINYHTGEKKEMTNIYKTLNNLYNTNKVDNGDSNLNKFDKRDSNLNKVDNRDRNTNKVDNRDIQNKFLDHRIIKYLFSNSLTYINIESLYSVYDSFSLTDTRLDEFLEYSVYKVRTASKRRVRKFVTLKSWVYEEHYVCNNICKEYHMK